MSFERTEQNVCVKLNEYFVLTVEFFSTYIGEGDPGNVPIDLTGKTIRVQVRETATSSTALLDLTDGSGLTVTPASGLIEINADTSAITDAGSYVWALEISGAGENEEPVFGRFTVESDVVRSP